MMARTLLPIPQRRPCSAPMVALAFLVILLCTPHALPAQDFETLPTLAASEILPPELLSSEHHNVDEAVENDGFMNIYTVNSKWGNHTAYGLTLLRYRIHETDALAKLEELSNTEVFADAVQRSVTGQVEAVKQFADKPAETVKGIPAGLGRTFRKYKRDAGEIKEAADDAIHKDDAQEGEEGSDEEDESNMDKAKEVGGKAADASEAYAKKYFGVTGAERRWAQKLQIDPYTSNQALRQELKRVSKVDATTSFGMKFAPIPRIPGVSYVGKVNQIVWSVDPRELREQNIQKLVEMGIDQDLVVEAFDNPNLSPTHQTILVNTVEALAGAEGLASLVESAKEPESEEEAIFFNKNIILLGWYHQNNQPVKVVFDGFPLAVFKSSTDRLVAMAAVEQVYWTEQLSVGSKRLREDFEDVGANAYELWLEGSISPRTRAGLETIGWIVHSNIQLPQKKDEEPVEG